MMTKKWWYFLLAIILVSSCSSSDDDELWGNWTKVNDFFGNQRSAASCFVIDNTVAYVGLGYNGKTQPSQSRNRDFFQYDVTRDTWTQIASLPDEAQARSHAAAFAIGKKGYICGGVAEIDKDLYYLNDLWEYDSENDSWTRKADLIDNNGQPAPRSEAIAAAVGNKGYVGAGRNDDADQLNDFYEYDPSTDQWKMLASVGGSKRRGGLCFVANNTIYVCLGTGNGSYYSDLQAYDIASNTWTAKRQMKNATDQSFDDDYINMERSHGVAFALDGKIYISTGYPSNATTWEYDPAQDLWEQKTTFEGSKPRYDAIGFSVYDSRTTTQRAFVGTGTNGSSRFDDMFEFKPTEEVNENDNG